MFYFLMFYTVIDKHGRFWDTSIGASSVPILRKTKVAANSDKNTIHNKYQRTVEVVAVKLEVWGKRP